MTTAIETIEHVLADAEQLADPRARGLARALAAAMIELVGDALGRVQKLGGDELARRLADDDLVGSLLVLCNLHPDAPAVRVERALHAASAALGSVGVALECVEATRGGVRVGVVAERGVPVDPRRVRTLIEALVTARAPDVETLDVELGGSPVGSAELVPVDRLRVAT